MHESRTLSRDVEAAAIPYGDKIPLKAGSTVFITQSLGGSYTVMTDMGYMVRIEGRDADSIGEQPPAAPEAADTAGKSVEQLCWDQLKTCYDPEIAVDIVNLGLVYTCEVAPIPEQEGQNKVTVHFTLTAPGCGMGDYLRSDVETKIKSVPGVKEADIQVVFDPPWNQAMMSDAARLQLGMM